MAGESRASHPSAALEEVARLLARRARPQVLDLGPVCDRNIEFFTSRGCRVFVEAAEDLRRLPERIAATATGEEAESEPPRPQPVLEYPDWSFDCIMLWDVMDYLPDPLARQLGGELARVSRHGSFVYMLSDARRSGAPGALLRYRIHESGSVAPEALPGESLSRISRENRDLFRLFHSFEVKRSILLRTQVRELLLERLD